MTELSHIRNFSIIAHIDHGKSTLADRLLEETNTVDKREMEAQILDNMELERERGITIKARAVKLNYRADNGEDYVLNLIDTPGHVDFNYEVSRSLTACEGAVLVVDASQGIEAQTLANTYLAVDAGLEVLPVVNKIDLPAARPQEVKQEIEDIIGIPAMDSPEISAKNGINIHSVLEMIVREVPAPKGDREAPLQALIFDSQYDSYRGVVVYLRVMNGVIRPGMDVQMMASGAVYKVVECGYLHPKGMIPQEALGAGEVGYLTASIKTIADTRVGDTVTEAERPASEPLPGYKTCQPMVFSGVYPADGSKYGDLRDALEKLKLNDASMSYTQENSIALGFGFRCGFLGLLHMEIIVERLEREFDLEIITTSPSVIYKIVGHDGTESYIENPSNLPDPTEYDHLEEPMVKATIMVPKDYVGSIMDLCQRRRGIMEHMEYITPERVGLHYMLPLNEVIYDFFDALKSKTRGYGSLDYEFDHYEKSNLVKLDILLNKELVDAFSMIVHESEAYSRGKFVCEKLKEVIPMHQFEVPIQAAIGQKIIARETIRAYRKDVLAKCYGGDISRKKKLLEKQKEGKKRMRQFGSVEVPQEAFTAVLKYDDGK
ncbi:MAG: translation elongation factor 4 [Clostridia bacterium]|nr:translation elongation factor 4 [Clostridia bacterium]